MVVLPNGRRARIDHEKLSAYVLNPRHPRGRHKAHVFRAALGLGAENAQVLTDALAEVAEHEEARLERRDEYGAHFSIDFVLDFAGRRALVRSLWIVRADEDFPRFVSAFVK